MFGFFKRNKKGKVVEDKIANLPQDDIPLKAYKERAMEGINYLIQFMGEHEKDDEYFKYAVKTNFIEDENSEHMWVQTNEFKDGYFFGRLANEPNTIKNLKYGDEVNVKLDDVEDWILQDYLTNTKVGGFSSDYIRKKANKPD